MPLFDQMEFNQKWSVWDTWRAFDRNVRTYLMTAGYKMGNIVTATYRRGQSLSAKRRRGEIITGV